MNANLAQCVEPSPTVTIATRVAEQYAKGESIIGLHVGEFEYDTLKHIKQAAVNAIENNFLVTHQWMECLA